MSDLNLQRQKKGPKAKGKCDEEGAYGNLCDLLDVLRKKNANANGENMAKEQSRLRETDKNITEGQSRLKETGENMAKEQSRLRETVTNELKKSRNLNEVAGSLFNKIQRNLGAVGKLLDEVWKMNSSAQPLCDKSWKHYGLSCYYKSTKAEPLNFAKEDCEKNKAHLVIINGEDEMNFLRGFSENQYWWIGLRRVSGTWEWSDGTSYEMTPKFWGKGQPNNSSTKDHTGGQDCVQFSNEKGWDDRHCALKYKYICEKEIP
ncbi:uncharacterized protein LOC143962515 [Lithobates pipiens]